jgi:carbonic anhydrase/acetyltransferase-like protein (isoleucine patch superfamily)
MMNIDESVYIAPGAQVAGNVQIGKDSSIWYNAVVRGDSSTVIVGERTNIQDLACLHVDMQNKLEVGNNVTIGHSAIVHGCIVGNNVIIGMGAIIMNGAHVGNNCIIGAGALVTENMVIPDGSMAFGSPAKVIRQLTDEEIARILDNAELYVQHAMAAEIAKPLSQIDKINIT